MKVVIHQPEYLPWLGFFHKFLNCDLFVAFDHVQFQRGFINRNRIKSPQGAQWLTIPVKQNMRRKPIQEVLINNAIDWRKEHLLGLEYNYSRAPYFKQHISFFKDVFSRTWEKISDLDMHIINYFMKELGIHIPIKESSDLDARGKSSELLIDICKKVKADTYLSGQGGRDYMDMDKFKDAGIKVEFDAFTHPKYVQQFPAAGFEENMSIVDLVFNHGPKSRSILQRYYE